MIPLILGATWIICGCAGWAISMNQMNRSWRAALNEERPTDFSDYIMLLPCCLIGPLSVILSLTYRP